MRTIDPFAREKDNTYTKSTTAAKVTAFANSPPIHQHPILIKHNNRPQRCRRQTKHQNARRKGRSLFRHRNRDLRSGRPLTGHVEALADRLAARLPPNPTLDRNVSHRRQYALSPSCAVAKICRHPGSILTNSIPLSPFQS